MEFRCRIKKALNIKSPAPYEYCSLKLNAYNKKRCVKCKYFNLTKYHFDLAKRLRDGIEKGIAEPSQIISNAMKAICEGIRNMDRKEERK